MSSEESDPMLGVKRQDTWLAHNPTPEIVKKFVKEEYVRDHYVGLAERARELIEKKLKTEGVQANVRCRAKESLEEKLRMRFKLKSYKTIEDIREDTVDLAGVRIVLYMPSQGQHDKVRKAITSIWGEVEPILHPSRSENREDDRTSEEEYRNIHLGYQAVHYRVAMQESHSKDGGYDWLPYDKVEIQVVSALVHAWAEVGHDILYKSHAYGKPTIQERRILDALNGLIQSGDLLLQQFQELVNERTYKEFAHPDKLGSYLRDLDILQCAEGRLEFEAEGIEILFRFLEARKLKYPLALRNALRELGFPEQNNLKEIVGSFSPKFQPAEKMLGTVCLIQHMIEGGKENTDITLPAKRCCVMMKALTILQTFFGSRESANKYLREDVEMAREEKESIEFVLTDPCRQYALNENDEEFDKFQETLKPQLQPAWDWFQQQADNPASICGLVFKLAEMGAAKDVDLSVLIDQLTIGSLSRSNTWNLEDETEDRDAAVDQRILEPM
ncbi:hypothetical protein CC78DRAFT_605216 [Lojkania enalia]|uniref:RelA/SpoT domain-containing protein n=1 Tax=Lojkania enalia TaxID=147567 RepID=A0A9P4N2P9_9PLEO|nr:hypothetical protein CC78DRAFT_605216 [Didymosphaeria enalia]